MRLRRWLVPEVPDVLGLMRRQLAVTIEGVDALAAWAGGDPACAKSVREAEERGDDAKRELLEAVREALISPLEPEDLFTLSQGIDWILNYSADLIGEAEAMDCPPDAWIERMARALGEALRELDSAVGALGSDGDRATGSADAAIQTSRRVESVYYAAMAASLEVPVQRERIARRELYRRCSRIAEEVTKVAERVVYAVVKEI
jgi:uncharacterized protein